MASSRRNEWPSTCIEDGCDDIVWCGICDTCNAHCVAAPNDPATHHANLRRVLARLEVHRTGGLLN